MQNKINVNKYKKCKNLNREANKKSKQKTIIILTLAIGESKKTKIYKRKNIIYCSIFQPKLFYTLAWYDFISLYSMPFLIH